MLSTLKILIGVVVGLSQPFSANAQSKPTAETAAEKKCIAFQQQVKKCNAAIGSSVDGKIPSGCAAILKTAEIKPCG